MSCLAASPCAGRVLHFHRLVAYWTAVFDRLRPDVLFMITAPHVVYDYVAYALARRRGIRTVLFEYVGTNLGLVMAIDQFDAASAAYGGIPATACRSTAGAGCFVQTD